MVEKKAILQSIMPKNCSDLRQILLVKSRLQEKK
jgi:hypothetical protein